MEIWTPCEPVGKPLIGSNHMHSIACREADETSMLVEYHRPRAIDATIEGRDVMAFVSECLQSIVLVVGDDDSALLGDAYTSRDHFALAAFGADFEQERAIDQRQYLHATIEGIGDDDSMSIMIDRGA